MPPMPASTPDDAARSIPAMRRTAPPRGRGEDQGGAGVGAVRRRLAERIGADRFERWIAPATVEVEGGLLRIEADSALAARWLESHLAEDLRDVARAVLGDDARVEVRARAARPAALRAAPAPRVEPASEESVRTAPRGPRLRSLDEFVVGESNRLAIGAARRFVEEPEAAAASPLFLHGECGVGKTHLLQGICRAWAERTGRVGTVRYVTGEQFTNEYIAAVRRGEIEAFRRRIRRLDLLAIDDVHFLSNKTRTQSEFLHTLDAIGLGGARIVLASDEHPRHIRRFSRGLVSRFLSGLVVRIDRPDRATRVAIVRRLCAERDIPVTDGAVEIVASRCVGSVRELEGAVTKLDALRSLVAPEGEAGEVGAAMAEQLLRDHAWKPPVPVRLGTILEAVCSRTGAVRNDVLGTSRHRRAVLARALVAHLGRELTAHSYPEIARSLGRTYHSTIHAAAQRLRRQMDEGQEADLADGRRVSVRELVDQLRHDVTSATA